MRFFVCRGKSCRKRKNKYEALVRELSGLGTVEEVDCQNVCKGPVVVLPVEKGLIWLKRVDSKKSRAALARLAANGKMSSSLRKRRVKKRAGRPE